jgi:hypothetical protein
MSESLKEIGASQAAALVEMVAALEVDYDGLEELRDDEGALNDRQREELAELSAAAGDCESRDDAEQRIREDALSVEMRSGWETVDVWQGADSGHGSGRPQPVEFMILLATGGPAARIMGELRDGQPHRAWLEVQDWGTPWMQYFDIEQDTLLAYASVFYFGQA